MRAFVALGVAAFALQAAEFQLTSSDITHGAPIPAKFTCDGAGRGVSPALSWTGAPAGTKSFALIFDDPDARGFSHWVVFNLPGTTSSLTEGSAGGGVNGTNGWGRVGYGGSCPPPGRPHHYHFKLYALDAPLSLDSTATKQAVIGAIQGHIIGVARLMGTYERRK